VAGGHFPNEQATLKVLYLTIQERRPNRSNPTGQINGRKSILNTLATLRRPPRIDVAMSPYTKNLTDPVLWLVWLEMSSRNVTFPAS